MSSFDDKTRQNHGDCSNDEDDDSGDWRHIPRCVRYDGVDKNKKIFKKPFFFKCLFRLNLFSVPIGIYTKLPSYIF